MNTSTLQTKLLDYFQWFHKNPELSYEEYRTTGKIRAILEAEGIEILPYPLDTGLVAIVRGKEPGPVQALRADIDALPVEEKTGLPYSSCNPGKMHACGHDFHITAAIGSAIFLQHNRQSLRGTVKFLFQPAEESAVGALKILGTDVMKDVDRIWGFHVSSLFDTGVLGISAGYVAAAVDKFLVTITGTGSHGARPHEGIDPVPAACAIVQALQTIISRNIDAFHPAVISVTRIEAGKTWNVIPAKAELEGTVRTLDQTDRALIEKRFREVTLQTTAAYGCTAQIQWKSGSPAVKNDAEMAALAARVGEACGYHIVPEGKVMSGDDFSFYQDICPGCYIRIGTGRGPAIHQPGFQVDPNALWPAVQYLTRLMTEAAVS